MWDSLERFVYRCLVVVTAIFVVTGFFFLIRRVIVGRYISG